MTISCPYGECPRGGGEWCDCWEAQSTAGVTFDPEPYPCEGCWAWSGEMKACDGCCEGHADRQWYAKVYGVNWECKQLIHNGGKP